MDGDAEFDAPHESIGEFDACEVESEMPATGKIRGNVRADVISKASARQNTRVEKENTPRKPAPHGK